MNAAPRQYQSGQAGRGVRTTEGRHPTVGRLAVKRPARCWKEFVKVLRTGALGVLSRGLNLQAALTQKLKALVLALFDRFIGQKWLVSNRRCIHQTQQTFAALGFCACAPVLRTDIDGWTVGQFLFFKNRFELRFVVLLKEHIVPI